MNVSEHNLQHMPVGKTTGALHRTCSSTGWTPRPTERLPAGANAASSSMQLGAQPCRPPSAEVSVPQLNLMGSLRLSQHSSSEQTPSDKVCSVRRLHFLQSLDRYNCSCIGSSKFTSLAF